MMMTRTEYRKDWRAQHKAKGLCWDCVASAAPGKVRCKFHLRKDSQSTQKRMRRIRPIWKAENKCTTCGNLLEEIGYTKCVNCRDQNIREVLKLGTFNQRSFVNA